MKKFTLYSKTSVLIFSLILTGFCGALMLGYNLRTVGKRKIVLPLVIITLVVDGIMFQLVKKITPDSLLRLFIPNLIAAIILSYPIWDTYVTMDHDEYNEKTVWIPVIVAVVLYGGLLTLNFIVK